MRPTSWPGVDGDGPGDPTLDGPGIRSGPAPSPPSVPSLEVRGAGGLGTLGAMADPYRLDDEETHAPVWVWLVVGALVVIGAFTVLRWVLGAITGLIGLAVLGLIVVGAVAVIRGAWRSRR